MIEKEEALYQRLYGLLGLAMRAGQVVSGQEACINAVRKKEVDLVFIEESVAENSLKKINESCMKYQCELKKMPDGALGKAIGKENRTAVGIKAGTLLDKIVETTQLMENKILAK